MTRRIATFVTAALLLFGGATLATTAAARDSFAVSIGVPGVTFGYSNYGYSYPTYRYRSSYRCLRRHHRNGVVYYTRSC